MICFAGDCVELNQVLLIRVIDSNDGLYDRLELLFNRIFYICLFNMSVYLDTLIFMHALTESTKKVQNSPRISTHAQNVQLLRMRRRAIQSSCELLPGP
jgi:hypothetical protein